MSLRIVSLVPSSTETLLALGAQVVACTKYCEQPHIAHVGGSKNPDIGAIVDLGPDLVVLDREENRIEDHDALVAAGVAVFVSDVTDLATAFAVVDDLAAAAGVDATGHAVRVPSTVNVTRPVPGRSTAFVPIWRRPWMTIGRATYGASLLDALGFDVLQFGDDAYPTVDLVDVADAAPDVVIVPSEPYEFDDGHLSEIADAMPAASIVRVDGQDLFWWGIRTPAALDRLARELAPPSTH
ncbi:MAG: helical backbone metal receptor [Ilumatobacter sp.]|uniref:helical backbone metal receptor n=1 Tax=Ilumatobacter sp. TaxID=1967498 RepID=UPI003296FC5C